MTSCTTDKRCCFSGRGKIRLAKYDPTCGFGPYTVGGAVSALANKDKYPLINIGNASDFALDITVNTIKPAKNMTGLSGISDCAPIEQIDNISLKMKLHCMSVANMAKALSGQTTTVAPAAGLTQAMTFTQIGQFIPFRDAAGNVITGVLDVTGFPATAVAGVDYILTSNGVEVPENSTLTLPSVFALTYDQTGYDQLQILMSTGGEYTLHFDGINAADKRPFAGMLYRIKIKPGGLGSLLSEGFMEINTEATVLEDCCSEKPGRSPYGTFPFGSAPV